MERLWKQIREFPNYTVSNYGEIVNEVTGRLMHQSATVQGAIKVNLKKNGVSFTRSVKVLVAEAFVPGKSVRFDTPIQLDGYQENTRADNLMWRPRWFAWKYTRQFAFVSDIHSLGPVIDRNTNIWYPDIYVAATTNGLLFKDVWRSIYADEPTFPTRQLFMFDPMRPAKGE